MSADSPKDLAAALRHHQDGQLHEASQIYRQLLWREPNNSDALHLLGLIAHQQGDDAEALSLIRRAIALRPDAAQMHSNLAGVLGKAGHPEEAVVHLGHAVRLRPDFAQAHNNLGVALEALGRLDEAIRAYRQALRIEPGYAECYNNLGNALQKRGHLSAAIVQHRHAFRIQPDYVQAYASIATALSELGHLDEAIAHRRTAVALRPGSAVMHSDLLFTLNYHPRYDAREIFEEHATWGRRHADPLPSVTTSPPNDPSDRRRIRVGYVSPNFRVHPVSRFFAPILRHHDPEAFETYCYSDVVDPDDTTQRLRRCAAVWRETPKLSDEELADVIRQDAIDILVDLTGHMGSHRLLSFARRPAPVQVSYLGYPNTTGMAAMDYRITDVIHDPPGHNDEFHTERLVRLDPCCWCYEPGESTPQVNELPALERGHVTFASLNRLVKATPRMVRLWAKILREVARSIVVVLTNSTEQDAPAIYELFEQWGIAGERLHLLRRRERADYLRIFLEIDVLLDTFPYNGHTTTCDSLWMGVPVVSLAGATHVSRAGVSVLSNVGLREFVADTEEDYVRRAVTAATDLDALAELRRDLRPRMERSPLRDEVGLTRRIEAAYREMWRSQWAKK